MVLACMQLICIGLRATELPLACMQQNCLGPHVTEMPMMACMYQKCYQPACNRNALACMQQNCPGLHATELHWPACDRGKSSAASLLQSLLRVSQAATQELYCSLVFCPRRNVHTARVGLRLTYQQPGELSLRPWQSSRRLVWWSLPVCKAA